MDEISVRPKAKALGLLTLAGLLLVVTVLAIALPFHESRNVIYWLWVMALAIFTTNALSLTILFPYGRKTFLAVAAIASLAVLFFFPWHYLQILGAFAFWGSVMFMDSTIRDAEKESLHFRYYQNVKKGISRFLVGVIFLASLNVFITYYQTLKQNPDKFYENTAVIVVKSAQPILQSKVQGFSPDMTLDEFLVRTEIFGQVEFTNGDGRGSFALDDASLAKTREEFLSLFGLEASGDEQFTEVLERLVLVRVREVFRPFESVLPFIYALILFLSLRFIIPVVVWVSGRLGALVFAVLVKFGWAKMSQKTVTIEIPELT